MSSTFKTNPKDFPQYNIETNGQTSDTIFSLQPIYSSDNTGFFLVAYRILDRKKYNISQFIDSLISLDNKINLITLFNDDDFKLFSDFKEI